MSSRRSNDHVLSVDQMSALSEASWKKTLTSIVEELDNGEYKKLVDYLDEIPTIHKFQRSRERFATILIKHYGFEGSVIVMKEAMNDLPRRDAKIQTPLRPFVEMVKEKQERNKGETESVVLKEDTMKKPDPKMKQTATGAELTGTSISSLILLK